MAVLRVSDSDYSVPTGTYSARLLGYTEKPPSVQFPDSGNSYVWEFDIIEGAQAGKRASRWTPTKLTTGNNFGKFVREMLGRTLVVNEDVDPDTFINKKFTITVGPSADGKKTKIIMVSPVATSMAPPPPGAPAPKPAPAAVAPVQTIDAKDKKVFVSRDGVEQGTFMDYDLAYAELGNPTWANAVVYDPRAKVYVPAREYLLPF